MSCSGCKKYPRTSCRCSNLPLLYNNIVMATFIIFCTAINPSYITDRQTSDFNFTKIWKAWFEGTEHIYSFTVYGWETFSRINWLVFYRQTLRLIRLICHFFYMYILRSMGSFTASCVVWSRTCLEIYFNWLFDLSCYKCDLLKPEGFSRFNVINLISLFCLTNALLYISRI